MVQQHKFTLGHINRILQHLTLKCKTLNCVSQFFLFTPVPAPPVFSTPVHLIRMSASLSGPIASWAFTSGGAGSSDSLQIFLLCESYRPLCLVRQFLKLSSPLQRLREIHVSLSVNTELEIPNFRPLRLNPKLRCCLAQFAAKIRLLLGISSRRPRSIS